MRNICSSICQYNTANSSPFAACSSLFSFNRSSLTLSPLLPSLLKPLIMTNSDSSLHFTSATSDSMSDSTPGSPGSSSISSTLHSAKLFFRKKLFFDSEDTLNNNHSISGSQSDLHSDKDLISADVEFVKEDDMVSYSSELLISSSALSQKTEVTVKGSQKSSLNSSFKSDGIYDLIVGASYLSKRNIIDRNYDTPSLSVMESDGHTRPDCGEDAFFYAKSDSHTCLGIADGVGGWNSFGVNPALFAWELMESCQSCLIKNPAAYPWTALEEGYEKVKSDGKIEAGSSTACILNFDRTNAILHTANLGDSGYLVLRLAEDKDVTSSDDEDLMPNKSKRNSTISKASSENGDDNRFDADKAVKYQSKALQHYFNAPYQLAILPSSFTYMQRANYMNDHPRVAHKSSNGPLRDGDIIILATDGLFDNLFVEEVIECVYNNITEFYAEIKKDGDGFNSISSGIQLLLRERIHNAAHELVSRAAYKSLSQTPSPFSQEAKLNGWVDAVGGKLDDVTVLTALVVRNEYSD